MDMNVKRFLGPSDAYIPTQVNEPMHDAHTETSVGLVHNPHVVQE